NAVVTSAPRWTLEVVLSPLLSRLLPIGLASTTRIPSVGTSAKACSVGLPTLPVALSTVRAASGENVSRSFAGVGAGCVATSLYVGCGPGPGQALLSEFDSMAL